MLAQQDRVLLYVGVGGRREDLPGGERRDGDGVLQHDLDAGALSCGAEGRDSLPGRSERASERARRTARRAPPNCSLARRSKRKTQDSPCKLRAM